MKNIIILLISVFLSVGIALAEPLPATQDSFSNEALEMAQGLQVVPQNKHEEDDELYYTINVNYPQISGKNLSTYAQTFNQMVNKIVTEEIQQFKNSVKRDLPHMNTLPEDIRKNNLDIDYDIDVIYPHKHQVISVRFKIEGMQAGRPHPFHRHRVLNFDLSNGKTLTLMALFKPHANFLGLFSTYARQKLNRELKDKWLIVDGTAPKSKNYMIWNLEADGVLITFSEYQVAPYVDGAPEVHIPYSALKNIIATNAPIASCVKNAIQCERKD